jgi:hypothetical protein
VRGVGRLAVGFAGALAVWLAAPVSGALAAPVNGAIAGLDLPHPVGSVGKHALAGRGLDASQNLPWFGGPVIHSNSVRLIFWNPSNSGLSWDPGYRELMTQFVQDVSADAGKQTNPYSLTPQYTDSTGPAPYNTTFGGAYNDADPAPASDCTPPSGWSSCVVSRDLAVELRSFVTANHLPTGMDQIYMLVTPQGLGSCRTDGSRCLFTDYCAFHSWSVPSGGHAGDASTLLWSDIPYTAGRCRASWPRPNGSTADTVISSLSHEHIETLTDPLETAWHDNSSPINEVGDPCASFQGHYLNGSALGSAYDTLINGHRYNIQGEWSNADGSCQMSEAPVASVAVSTAGLRRVSGAPIAFDGSRSGDPDGSIAAYAWSFGDGSTASGSAPSHVYARTGSYSVTLKVTDIDGVSDSIVYGVAITPAASITSAWARSRGGRRFVVLSVSGPGVAVVNGHRFHARGAGQITFRAPITAQQARRLAKHRKVSLKIRFVPLVGGVQALTVTLR